MNNFDDLLDDVLREETRTEARPGMEQRILARVREEGVRRSYLPRMGWMVGALMAACLVVAVAFHPWQRRMHDAPLPSAETAPIPSPPANASPRVDSRIASGISPVKDASPHRHGRVVSVQAEAAQPADVRDGREPRPKLDTFPAVTQKGEPSMVSSPAAVQAMQELKAEQEQPVTVAAIEIKPL
jgi:hypothetical protein